MSLADVLTWVAEIAWVLTLVFLVRAARGWRRAAQNWEHVAADWHQAAMEWRSYVMDVPTAMEWRSYVMDVPPELRRAPGQSGR